MSSKQIAPYKLRPAKRGSKQGWVMLSGQVPPEVGAAFLEIAAQEEKHSTDLVCEAVIQLVQSKKAA